MAFTVTDFRENRNCWASLRGHLLCLVTSRSVKKCGNYGYAFTMFTRELSLWASCNEFREKSDKRFSRRYDSHVGGRTEMVSS